MNRYDTKFNRLWIDTTKAWPVKPTNYVPSYLREGFDESKVIKLDYKGDEVNESMASVYGLPSMETTNTARAQGSMGE